MYVGPVKDQILYKNVIEYFYSLAEERLDYVRLGELARVGGDMEGHNSWTKLI